MTVSQSGRRLSPDGSSGTPPHSGGRRWRMRARVAGVGRGPARDRRDGTRRGSARPGHDRRPAPGSSGRAARRAGPPPRTTPVEERRFEIAAGERPRGAASDRQSDGRRHPTTQTSDSWQRTTPLSTTQHRALSTEAGNRGAGPSARGHCRPTQVRPAGGRPTGVMSSRLGRSGGVSRAVWRGTSVGAWAGRAVAVRPVPRTPGGGNPRGGARRRGSRPCQPAA
jgi:hypothetical protein